MVHRSLLLGKVDVRRRLGYFALGLDQTALQCDDVVAQAVIFVLQGLVVIGQIGIVAHLLFEGFDVAFFALAEGTLFAE